MNISQIITAARAFLPAGSPLIEKMERAQELAGGFSASPDGVRAMMARLGKSQQDLQQALAMLDNPMVSGMLNRIAPGMADTLRSTGAQLMGQGSPSTGQHSLPAGQGDALAGLRAKIAKL